MDKPSHHLVRAPGNDKSSTALCGKLVDVTSSWVILRSEKPWDVIAEYIAVMQNGMPHSWRMCEKCLRQATKEQLDA